MSGTAKGVSASSTGPLPSELLSAVAGLLQLLHHERQAGGTEHLGAMPEDDHMMPTKAEVLVPVGALHPDRAFAQEPALEFAARDHDLPRPSAYRGWLYRPWRRSRPRGAVGAAAPPGTGGTLVRGHQPPRSRPRARHAPPLDPPERAQSHDR